MNWIAIILIVTLSCTNISDEETAWIRAHAIPIATPTAGSGFADLQKLKSIIGDSRIVALGEATHGTKEFFQMKHRITEFLASEMGFTMFAIEANMPEAYRVNDYVLTGKGDPRELLKGMYFWTWNTQEVLDMIAWMRSFNASGKGRIQFVGFDTQTPGVALDIVRSYVSKTDPAYVRHLDSLQIALDSINAATKQGRSSLTFAQRALQTSNDLVNHLAATRSLYEAKEDPGGVEWIIQNARIVDQAMLLSLHTNDRFGMRIRDSSMAANFSWILDSAPDSTRIVLWAHNGHVTKHEGRMGSFLTQRYGKKYLAIAQTCYSGRYTARVKIGMGLSSDNIIAPPKAESLEAYCHSTGIPMFILDTRAATVSERASAWLTRPTRMRSIGAVVMEDQQYVINFSRDFDAFVYFENTEASVCFGIPLTKQ